MVGVMPQARSEAVWVIYLIAFLSFIVSVFGPNIIDWLLGVNKDK